VTEARKTIWRQKIAIFGLVIALVFTLAGLAIASATVSNSDGTVNGCYKNKKGQLRVAMTPCVAGKETPIQIGGETPMFARVAANGTLLGGKHVISASHSSTGIYDVTFDRDISACAYSANGPDFAPYFANVSALKHSSNQVEVLQEQINNSGFLDGTIQVTVTC